MKAAGAEAGDDVLSHSCRTHDVARSTLSDATTPAASFRYWLGSLRGSLGYFGTCYTLLGLWIAWVKYG